MKSSLLKTLGVWLAIALLPLAGGVFAEALPDWWPEDVPLVDEAVIDEVDDAGDGGLPSVDLKVSVEAYTPEKLVERYRQELESKGWTIDAQRDTGLALSFTATKRNIDRRVIITAKKPGTVFNRDANATLLEVIVYRSIP